MFTLNIYDKKSGDVKKTVKAKEYDLTFGVVRKLSKIFEFDKLKSDQEIAKTVMSSIDILSDILEEIFPDMADEDWDGVKISELTSLIIDIGKHAITRALTIPVNSKKLKRGHQKSPSFYDLLFVIIYNLCKEYNAFTPFELENMPYCEVMRLYGDTRKLQIENEKEVGNKGNEKIYVPTKRNDW